MVEKSHTAAGHESLLDPLRNAGEKIANFFAPSADAASTGDVYEINVELPVVAEEDVTVELHGNVLVVKGDALRARGKGQDVLPQNVGLGLFIGPSGCRRMSTPSGLKPILKTVSCPSKSANAR